MPVKSERVLLLAILWSGVIAFVASFWGLLIAALRIFEWTLAGAILLIAFSGFFLSKRDYE